MGYRFSESPVFHQVYKKYIRDLTGLAKYRFNEYSLYQLQESP